MVSAGSIVCTSPQLATWSAEASRAVTIEVSLNSQQYTNNNASFFSFYEQPILSEISPSLGPVGGNTRLVINGSAALGGRGTHTLCRFNDTIVVATYVDHGISHRTVVCPSATGFGAAVADVRLSLNGQQYAASYLCLLYTSPSPRDAHES
eukprot:3727745-Prymnesium_polylepis.1